MIKRNQFLPIETLTPSADKRTRAKSIQGRMRSGTVFFDMEADWYPTLFNEMITFDRGKYMDQVDALSCIGLGLNKLVPTYSAKEISDIEWEDEYQDDYDAFNLDGRSSITGY